MRTRAIADAKVKTDRFDAAVQAQLLVADFLPDCIGHNLCKLRAVWA